MMTTMMMMTMVPVIAFLPGSVFECDCTAREGESQTAAIREQKRK
jgi:hypothetical protein